MKQDWTDQLRNKMAGYEEQPPEGLWNDIEKSLDNITTHNNPNKRAWIRVLKYSSATIAAAILCLIGFFFANKQNSIHPGITASKVISLSANKHIEVNKKDKLSTDKNLLASNEDFKTKRNTRISKSYTVVKDSNSEKSNNEMAYTEVPSKTATETDTVIKRYGKNDATNKKEYDYPKHYYNNNALEQSMHHSQNNLEFNLYVSNIPSQEINNNGYSSLLMAARTNNNGMMDVRGVMGGPINEYKNIYESSNPLLNIQSNSLNNNNAIKIKHKQPVRFGITAKYDIASQWAIETGFTYTYLTSDIYSGAEANNYQSKQKLHYVGIPINAIFSIWKNKIISVYISGGGMGEYCVDGKLTTDYTINNVVESSADEKIRDHHILWSINSSLGFQYSFLPHCGVYIEPGVSHYFKDGSDIQTIYKEHPTDFSIKFGIRFSIK